MPATREETALAALAQVLAAVPAVRFARNPADEDKITVTEGQRTIVLRDGDAGEPEEDLGGGGYSWFHRAAVEAYVTGAARDAALAQLLADIRDALLADRTLGGAVDDLVISPPQQPEGFAVDGGQTSKGREIPVVLIYDTDGPLG